jgi:hypothetical protein
MQSTIYADGLANIQLIDGVVRCDLVNMSPSDKNPDQFNLRSVGTLALSLPALMRTHDQLGKVIDALVAKGLLKKTNPQEPVAENLSTSKTNKTD